MPLWYAFPCAGPQCAQAIRTRGIAPQPGPAGYELAPPPLPSRAEPEPAPLERLAPRPQGPKPPRAPAPFQTNDIPPWAYAGGGAALVVVLGAVVVLARALFSSSSPPDQTSTDQVAAAPAVADPTPALPPPTTPAAPTATTPPGITVAQADPPAASPPDTAPPVEAEATDPEPPPANPAPPTTVAKAEPAASPSVPDPVPAQAIVTPAAGPLTTAQIVARCEPSVALIKGKISSGTGFLVKPNLVATNAHVLDDEFVSNLEVRFPGAPSGDPGPLHAQLMYEDPKRDLAFLAVSTKLPALQIAPAYRFIKGEDITVIGNPGMGDGQVLENAVSKGVMSSKTEIEGNHYLQMNIAINPGNSGGPVFDSSGRVIGVATLKATKAEATAFCIPVEDLQKAVAQVGKPRPEFSRAPPPHPRFQDPGHRGRRLRGRP